MTAILAFSFVAAALVFLAGRKDAARDPRLTVSLLLLLAAFPLMAFWMPKIPLFPPAGEPAENPGLPWERILLAVWAAGFAVSMGRVLLAWMILKRWRKRSAVVARVQGIEVRESGDISGPMAAGVRRPVILVPSSWHSWPDDYRRVVLEHELAHHRRRDPLWRLLARMACAVYWFHPLVRWMMRRFVMQCEFACDAAVLRGGIDPKRYARVLCDFADSASPSPLAPGMADACPLEARVRRMLGPARSTRAKSLAALATLGMLAAASFAVIGRAPSEEKPVTTREVRLRLTADPFPGGH